MHGTNSPVRAGKITISAYHASFHCQKYYFQSVNQAFLAVPVYIGEGVNSVMATDKQHRSQGLSSNRRLEERP